MQVPRTYISKIENGKAIPTLSSLDRLANALEISVCLLLRDGRCGNERETELIMADPFLAELAAVVSLLDPIQRSQVINQVREMASGRRRLA
jgi:transcriptional regulator with XRE-family HTH domain